jgi:DivIVA domain-containing protein
MDDGHDHAHPNVRSEIFGRSMNGGSCATGKVLTAQDVRGKVFTTARLREGYDLAEVDVFLNEVESSLRRLHQENGRLTALMNGGDDPRADIPPVLGEAGLRNGMSTRTAALLISHAQEEAAAIRAQAEADARALVQEAREGLRGVTEILGEAHTAGARELRELDRWRGSLENHLAQIEGLIGRFRHEDESSPEPGGPETDPPG